MNIGNDLPAPTTRVRHSGALPERSRHLKKNDSYGLHEALHTASIGADFVDRQLLDHPCIKKNKRYRKLAGAAFDSLFELYQAIGADHLLPEKKNGDRK
jgi:hypothetical protein